MKHQIKEVRSALPPNSRDRSNVVALALLAFCAATWTISMVLISVSPLWFTWVAILGNGIAIAMLFIVGHDAAHDNFVRSHQLNRLIATLAFLPGLHPRSSWAHSHNLKHHAWTNLKGEDPGYAPFSLQEYRRLPLYRRLLERFYRTSIGLGLFYFFEVYCKDMVFPRGNRRPADEHAFLVNRVTVALFFVFQCSAVYWIAVSRDRPHPILFTFYAVIAPLAVFVWLMGFVTLQHHTHPEIPWFDKKQEWSFFQCQVAGTTHIRFPRIFDVVLLNILEHSAHHVDPLIPLYRLQSSQSVLDVAYSDSIKTIEWSPLVLWKTLCQCKLYDYREHRWLDFNGKPTTARLLPQCATSTSDPLTEECVTTS